MLARGRTLSGRHSADGRREILAAPANSPIRIDGVLDEDVWQRAEPAEDFVQAEPLEGEAASERTVVRMAYDADNLYIGAKLYSRVGHVITDIKKDFAESDQDGFSILLDTFGDRRNAYVFSTNPEGARHDRQVALEGREVNQSWDAVWEVRTRLDDDGWTAEIRIPFRALRFNPASSQPWGVNFSRHLRRRNELDYWSPVPRSFDLNRVSLAGNLAGLQTGSAGRDLRVKPYVASSSVREVGTKSAPKPSFATTGDVGVDVRAALTPGITMDVTVNPDFGQVEADEQQVNLTQFSQFFPEKRDFFLENSGIFYVGDAARNNRVNPTPTPDEDNLLFFSRRIGLTSGGAQLPILGGVRVTGRLSEGTRIGILSVQEREDGTHPGVNSSVLRLRQNLGRAGNDIGFFAMQTLNTTGSSYHNRVFGADNNYRLFGNLDWNSYVVKTETPGIDSGDYAWRSTLNWEGNFFHGKGGVMQLGSGFQNDLGYYRRTGVRKYLLDTGLRPRSASLREHGIREFHPHVVWNYQENLAGEIAGKTLHTGWSTFFNNGAVVEVSINPNANRLTSPLRPNAKMRDSIPAGLHSWTVYMVYVMSDQSRKISTNTRIIVGGLYTGTQRTINGSVTIRPTYRFRTTVGLQRTSADLGDLRIDNDPSPVKFVNSFWTLRANYSFTTNMFVDALSQYDGTTKQFNANIRFNLIHHPLSDIFIVYNDQRFLTSDNLVPGRALILKVTQMFSF